MQTQQNPSQETHRWQKEADVSERHSLPSGGHLTHIRALNESSRPCNSEWSVESSAFTGSWLTTLTAINDTVAQTAEEAGRAAISSAYKLLSRSAEYSGTARWRRASKSAARQREPCGEGRGGECHSALIMMYRGDGHERRRRRFIHLAGACRQQKKKNAYESQMERDTMFPMLFMPQQISDVQRAQIISFSA